MSFKNPFLVSYWCKIKTAGIKRPQAKPIIKSIFGESLIIFENNMFTHSCISGHYRYIFIHYDIWIKLDQVSWETLGQNLLLGCNITEIA